jgi:hypothetical protein
MNAIGSDGNIEKIYLKVRPESEKAEILADLKILICRGG